MVDFVLKADRKFTNFEYKNDYNSKNKNHKKRKIHLTIIRFSTLRIFHEIWDYF